MSPEAPKGIDFPHETNPAWEELRGMEVSQLRKLVSDENPDRLQVEMARVVLGEKGKRGAEKASENRAKEDIPDYRTEINKMMEHNEEGDLEVEEREDVESIEVRFEDLSESGKLVFLQKVEDLSGIGPVKTIEDVMENKVFEEYREQAMAHAQVFGEDK